MGSIRLELNRQKIHVIYLHKACKFRLSTGVTIPDRKYWNSDKSDIRKTFPNYKAIRTLLDSYLTEVINATVEVRRLGLEPTVDAVKAAYHGKFKQKDQTDQYLDSLELSWDFDKKFKEFLQERSHRSRNHLDNLKQCHRVTLEYLKSVPSDIIYFVPSQINKRTVERFINYMYTHCEYQDSTIEKHLSSLRNFMNWCDPERTYGFLSYPRGQEVNVIYLYESELRRIIATPLTGFLHKTRDLLVFLSTTGMRYQDSQEFDYSWVEDDVIDYIQKKTGANALVPLKSITADIVRRWGNKAPRMPSQKFNVHVKTLLSQLDITRKVKIIESRGNKKIAGYKPICEVASSHIGRKTFITLSLMSGIPIQDVMRMSGHADYRSMKPYIDISREHLKQVAGKWVI